MTFEINKNSVCTNAPKIIIVNNKFMIVSVRYAFNGIYWTTGYEFTHRTGTFGYEGHSCAPCFGDYVKNKFKTADEAIDYRKRWIAESLKDSYDKYKDERFLPIIELLTPKQLQLF